MEAVAEGLWGLAEEFEEKGNIGPAVKCLEAICQSQVSFLPIIEVKTRLRIATLLLNYTDNVTHAKMHLERAQLLLKQIPSCFELKCRAYSLLSQCYHLVGTIPPQKQTLKKGLELTVSSGEGESAKLWSCNFNLQLANALTTEGDFQGAISALETGLQHAKEAKYSELEMVFATSILHVHLMQWEDPAVVEKAVETCDTVWNSIPSDQKHLCRGLQLYNDLLHTFYLLRICDYKEAQKHVTALDAALQYDMQQTERFKELSKELKSVENTLSRSSLQEKKRSELSEKQKKLQEELREVQKSKMDHNGQFAEPSSFGNPRSIWKEKLELGPPPLNGEWLPKSAVYVLVDLMAVLYMRPKGTFKECIKRIESGMSCIEEELEKLGISGNVKEVDLQHWAIWMAGVYLMLLVQLLENRVIIDLTRTEFTEAQEVLVQIIDWFERFPTILQGCENTIQMLLGQYTHSIGCFSEAALHFTIATKLTESKSTQAMCQIYAAISYICIGDAESSSQALDLIGPVYRSMDSYVGVREKTGALFASGLLQMKQHNLQEARTRLASGLKVTHKSLGNLQLVSQYLTVLGSLALALHDIAQARDILKSSLTLAKALHDIPTQIGVLAELTALYRELGETANEKENSEYEAKRVEDLTRRIESAKASPHHLRLLKFGIER
uniref:Tetratricopeptide repeat (TPR)-like superfamily protein n=1 Tax=Cupressus sempervirens TaxID=13469 RepID=A0A3S6N119_CUPSE|nr:tetratricopeptide repeat (TPR)-like superfamily protein [Cupressus sempervirens]